MGMILLRQIGTLSVSNALPPERPRTRPSQKHIKKHRHYPQIIEAEPCERDEATLIALRRSIARSLMELSEGLPGRPARFTLSGDGYKVYRIGIGAAEVLMAVKESGQGTQVKYVYCDGSGGMPELWTGEFRDARAVAAKEKAAAGIGRNPSGPEALR